MAVEEARRGVFLPFANYYFFLFSFQAVILTFFPVYCRDLGFTPFQIAVVASAENVASVIGPVLFFQLAHYLVPLRVLFIGAHVVGLGALLPLLAEKDFPVVLAFWFGCLFMNRPFMAFANAAAIRSASRGLLNFGHARLWGSIGFIIATYAIGAAVDAVGSAVVIKFGLGFLLLLLLSAFWLLPHMSEPTHEVSSVPLRSLFSRQYHGTYVLLLAVIFLTWISHGGLYTYLSLHLKTLGWSGAAISTAWSVGVVAEILLFIWYERFAGKLKMTHVLCGSTAMIVVRFSILGSTTETVPILLSQTLHAFTFGSFYVVTLKLVYRMLPDSLKDRGLGLLISAAGLGLVTGRLGSGVVASSIPGTEGLQVLFLLSAVVGLLAFAVSTMIQEPEANHTPEGQPSGV